MRTQWAAGAAHDHDDDRSTESCRHAIPAACAPPAAWLPSALSGAGAIRPPACD